MKWYIVHEVLIRMALSKGDINQNNYSTIWSMKSAAVMTVDEAFAFLIFFHLCAW